MRAVLFDLDDTLYLQASWLEGAWDAVAEAAADQGIDAPALRQALGAVAAEGSDRGRIIDRALEAIGHPDVEIAPLLDAFRGHRPPHLPLLPGVAAALDRLHTALPIGLITDGDPAIQEAKLAGLGLTDAFDVVVFSDELGRAHRKPDPAPFHRALRALGIEPADAVYVGDRPDKDVGGPMGIGMRAVRVRTGEHAHVPDLAGTWRSVPDVTTAIDLLLAELRLRAT